MFKIFKDKKNLKVAVTLFIYCVVFLEKTIINY